MRVLLTGARGKVGRAAVGALQRAGHDVTATDLAEPDFNTPDPGAPAYVKAQLTDAGEPYALSKLFGEQLCDAAVARSDLRCISLRPTWVQDVTSYARNLGPLLRDRSKPSVTGWAYIDADDLAEAIRLAVESDLPGHEVM